MLVIAALTIVVAYMVNAAVGFVLTAAIVLFILGRPRHSLTERLLTVLVLTMPLYSVGIVPGVHHTFSWSTILLLALTLVCAGKIKSAGPGLSWAIGALVVLTGATNLLSSSATAGAYYAAQFLIFALPIAVLYASRHWVLDVLGPEAPDRLLHVLASTLMACSVGVLVQAGVHRLTGREIGSISHFAQRVSYDLTINAYSVLSVILGVGMVMAPMVIRRGAPLRGIALLVSSGVAIVVNSSRTGLVVGAAVLLVALWRARGPGDKYATRLLLVPAGLFALWLYRAYSAVGRGTLEFLDDNGRFETYSAGLETLVDDPIVFLTGTGYVLDQTGPMTPHNFLIETMVRSGVVIAAVVTVLVVGLLWYLRTSQWQYLVWVLLGGSLFFSGFYAVKAAVIIACVVLIAQAAEVEGFQSPRVLTWQERSRTPHSGGLPKSTPYR